MLRSRFLWKLFGGYAALVVVTSTVIGLLIDAELRGSLVRSVESGLREKCALVVPIADRLLREESEALSAELTRLADEARVRVTVISADGEVIAESFDAAGPLDSHADRPEIIEALARGEGLLRRFSKTVGVRLLYAARAVPPQGDPLGVVRVAIPLTEVEAELAEVRRRVVIGAGIGTIAALFLGLLLAQRLTAPVRRMIETADALRRGEFETRVSDLPIDEIGVLGDALNRLGEEITRRIARLSADEAQLRAMLAGMVEGVVAVDQSDRVVFSNDAARRLLGIHHEELVGTRLWELVRLAELDALVEEARDHAGAARRELVVATDDGETVLEADAHPFDAPAATGVVIVIHDITELRRLERVRRDFVQNVSHELKTPLTSIRGYVETLIDGALHDQDNNERFLAKIESNVHRLNHLVADLLSLARIESQQDELALAPVDLRPLVSEAARRHEASARQKSIECRMDVPDRPLRVLGDRESMTQVIDNLFGNAIKYTPEGGHVDLRVREEEGFGVLEVEDDGIGIPPEDLQRVFERFYRVDKARSRDLGGTGLGLSIVKNTVQAMSGDVSVASELGKGSRFRVRVPLAAPRAAPPQKSI